MPKPAIMSTTTAAQLFLTMSYDCCPALSLLSKAFAISAKKRDIKMKIFVLLAIVLTISTPQYFLA